MRIDVVVSRSNGQPASAALNLTFGGDDDGSMVRRH
jgi:hypothetical protein